MKNLSIRAFGLFILALALYATQMARAQDSSSHLSVPFQGDSIFNRKDLTVQEAEKKFGYLMFYDKGVQALNTEITKRGFFRSTHPKARYGYEGSVQTKSGMEKVSFYAYDYTKAGYDAFASIVYIKRGKIEYKAFLIFPEKEKDWEAALAKSVEYYADGNNKIQRANSWGKCFAKRVKNKCASACFNSISKCVSVTARQVSSNRDMDAPTAIAIFLGCCGFFCVGCVAAQAIGCL